MKFCNQNNQQNYIDAIKFLKGRQRDFCLAKNGEVCNDRNCDNCPNTIYLNDIPKGKEKEALKLIIECNRTYPTECGRCLIDNCGEGYCASKFIKMFNIDL